MPEKPAARPFGGIIRIRFLGFLSPGCQIGYQDPCVSRTVLQAVKLRNSPGCHSLRIGIGSIADRAVHHGLIRERTCTERALQCPAVYRKAMLKC